MYVSNSPVNMVNPSGPKKCKAVSIRSKPKWKCCTVTRISNTEATIFCRGEMEFWARVKCPCYPKEEHPSKAFYQWMSGNITYACIVFDGPYDEDRELDTGWPYKTVSNKKINNYPCKPRPGHYAEWVQYTRDTPGVQGFLKTSELPLVASYYFRMCMGEADIAVSGAYHELEVCTYWGYYARIWSLDRNGVIRWRSRR